MSLLLTCWLSVLTAHGFEPPQFWSAQANRCCVSEAYRRYCLKQLFTRHVRCGMTVSQLARLLDHPTWLADRDVRDETKDRFSTGALPVEWHSDETVFTLDTVVDAEGHPEGVYLRLSGTMTTEAFLRVLQDGLAPKEDLTILQVAYFAGFVF
jgi:hypothetical protein